MNRHNLEIAFLVMLAAVAACSGEPKSPLAPSCTYTVTLATSAFGGGGGTSEASVKAPAGCGWTAVSRADWITIRSGANGSSDGTVSFSVAPFDGAEPRAAALVIAQQTLSVTQNLCDARPKPEALNFADSGGQADMDIEVDAGCRWTAEPGAAWVAVAPASGVGPARVTVRIEENRESEREAVLRVNSRPVTIRQGAEPCGFEVTLTPASFLISGGQGRLGVRTRRGCAWQADTGGTGWLTFPGSASGNGLGEIAVEVAPNAEVTDRRATIRVGSASADVVQRGQQSCEYRVQPAEALVRTSGGSGSVAISTAPGCRWTATNTQPFVRLSGEGPHTGSATIGYEVGANPELYFENFRKAAIELRWETPARGQNVWLRQFGVCGVIFLKPVPSGGRITEVSFDASGGTQKAWIQAEPPFTCTWRIEGATDWVSATGFGVGTGHAPDDPPFVYRGDGHVEITVSPNPSSQRRSMILQIGERPLTVIQAGR